MTKQLLNNYHLPQTSHHTTGISLVIRKIPQYVNLN